MRGMELFPTRGTSRTSASSSLNGILGRAGSAAAAALCAWMILMGPSPLSPLLSSGARPMSVTSTSTPSTICAPAPGRRGDFDCGEDILVRSAIARWLAGDARAMRPQP
jgi:hypothetical protein